ncbi:sensor histidine kinase [Kitasatospora xanthocidica]|uniref:Oxygen sensor histidine kinase NreB n=1 Tax=Kitasatospora xanthocidica TaxID=83382 RepID=A0A373A1X7_9ACTN|nr:sensor histidine kinase [Kitasatospora xanthocidica]
MKIRTRSTGEGASRRPSSRPRIRTAFWYLDPAWPRRHGGRHVTGLEKAALTTRQQVADLIEQRTPEIVEAYEASLRAAGNAIAQSPASLDQALATARQIVADVVTSLRVGQVEVDQTCKLLAWDVGATRAADGVHPRESVQASSAFFHAALSTIFSHLPPGSRQVDTLTLITLALERGVALRIRESVAAYTGLLVDKIHEAQLDERRRIARELHDRIGHGMSVTHRQLELYTLYLDKQPDRASVKLATAQQAIQESMHHLRAVTSDLHTRQPLKSLEKALLNDLESLGPDGVAARLRVNGDEAWAPPEVLDEVFLILREGVRNSLRHARATVLLVNVEITPNELRATVEDDGCGLPQERPADAGVGLSSMRERAELLGGRLLVNSRPDNGTRVDLSVPLKGRLLDEPARRRSC